MLTRCRGIVLRCLKYNDESLVAHILTEREGCTAFLVRIPKTKRGGVRPLLLQPLALVEVEWDVRPGRTSLSRLKSLRPAQVYASVPYDTQKAAVALFLAEFLHHALGGEPASEALFEYVWQSMCWLDASRSDYANFHLVFLLRMSRFLGFFPNADGYAEGSYFDLLGSTFCAVRPRHDHFLEPEDARHLPALLRMKYQNMHLFHLNGAQRSRLLQFAADYYRLHLPQFPELKSLAVLQQLFA